MPSSASTSLMMPRFLTKTSTKASCSALRRWKRPSWKRPSIWVSQLPQWSRVTANSPPQTGQRPMTGWSIRRRTPSLRGSFEFTPAVEETDLNHRLALIKYSHVFILSIVVLILVKDGLDGPHTRGPAHGRSREPEPREDHRDVRPRSGQGSIVAL